MLTKIPNPLAMIETGNQDKIVSQLQHTLRDILSSDVPTFMNSIAVELLSLLSHPHPPLDHIYNLVSLLSNIASMTRPKIDSGSNTTPKEILTAHNTAHPLAPIYDTDLYPGLDRQTAQDHIHSLARLLAIDGDYTPQIYTRAAFSRELLNIISGTNIIHILHSLIQTTTSEDFLNVLQQTRVILPLSEKNDPLIIHIQSIDIEGMYAMNFNGREISEDFPKIPVNVSLAYLGAAFKKAVSVCVKKEEALIHMRKKATNEEIDEMKRNVELLKQVRIVRNGGDEYSIVLISGRKEDTTLVAACKHELETILDTINPHLSEKFRLKLHSEPRCIDCSQLYSPLDTSHATDDERNRINGTLFELVALVMRGNLPHPDEMQRIEDYAVQTKLKAVYAEAVKHFELIQGVHAIATHLSSHTRLEDSMQARQAFVSDTLTQELAKFISNPCSQHFITILEHISNTCNIPHSIHTRIQLLLKSNAITRMQFSAMCSIVSDLRDLYHPNTDTITGDFIQKIAFIISNFLESTFLEMYNPCLGCFALDKTSFLESLAQGEIRAFLTVSIDIKPINKIGSQLDGDLVILEVLYDKLARIVYEYLTLNNQNIPYDTIIELIRTMRAHGKQFDEIKDDLQTRLNMSVLDNICLAQAGPDIVISIVYPVENTLPYDLQLLDKAFANTRFPLTCHQSNIRTHPFHTYIRIGADKTDAYSILGSGVAYWGGQQWIHQANTKGDDFLRISQAGHIFEVQKNDAERVRKHSLYQLFNQCSIQKYPDTSPTSLSDPLTQAQLEYLCASLAPLNNRTPRTICFILDRALKPIRDELKQNNIDIPTVEDIYQTILCGLYHVHALLNDTSPHRESLIQGVVQEAYQFARLPSLDDCTTYYHHPHCIPLPQGLQLITSFFESDESLNALQRLDVKQMRFVAAFIIIYFVQHMGTVIYEQHSQRFFVEDECDALLNTTGELSGLYRHPFPCEDNGPSFAPRPPSMQSHVRTSVYGKQSSRT